MNLMQLDIQFVFKIFRCSGHLVFIMTTSSVDTQIPRLMHVDSTEELGNDSGTTEINVWDAQTSSLAGIASLESSSNHVLADHSPPCLNRTLSDMQSYSNQNNTSECPELYHFASSLRGDVGSDFHHLKVPTISPLKRSPSRKSCIESNTDLCPPSVITLEDEYLMQSWSSQFNWKEFLRWDIWRAGILEGIGIMMFVYANAALIISISSGHYSHPELATATITGIFIAFFILALAPASGGHFSWLISMGAFTTKLISFPRMLVYIFCQALGAIFGALLVWAVASSTKHIPICAFAPTVSYTAAFINELMACLILLFLCWYCVLDTRQGHLVWKGLGISGPTLVGVVFAILIVIGGSGSIQPGLGIAGMNPARCIALSVVTGRGSLTMLSVYIFAPIVAAVIHGIIYNLIPPYHDHFYRLHRQNRWRNKKLERATLNVVHNGMPAKSLDKKPIDLSIPDNIVIELHPD